MLLCTKTHFIKSLAKVLEGEEGSGTEEEKKAEGTAMTERIRLYATDQSGLNPGPSVWFWTASTDSIGGGNGVFSSLFKGAQPKPGQRVVYVGGGFDLFSSGHIAFLRQVHEAEEKIGRDEGWYSDQAVQERIGKGEDYGPVFVVAGIYDDKVINSWKGINYPIMNIYERGLCVLQCKASLLMKSLRTHARTHAPN
jgi:ethanolamine-phosphate cytidylyltransferase